MSTASKGNRKACEVDGIMTNKYNNYKVMAKEHRYRAGRFPRMCNVDGFDRLYGSVVDAILMEVCDSTNLAAHRKRIETAAGAHWTSFHVIIASYPPRIKKGHGWRFFELRSWHCNLWIEVTDEFMGVE